MSLYIHTNFEHEERTKKILFACSHYSYYFNDFFSLFFSSFSFISSQPPLSSHFLLHLPSEFLSFPPLPICVSPSTINPARLPSSDLALPPTQLRSSPSVDPSPIQPFRRPSSDPALPLTQLRSSPSADPARQSPQPIPPTQLTDLPSLLTGPTPLPKHIPPLTADTHSIPTQAVGFAVFNMGFRFNGLWV